MSATEPWQRAVTVGYVCTVACDLNDAGAMSGEALSSFAVDKRAADGVTNQLCQALPATQRFDKLDKSQLTRALQPAITSPSPCTCGARQ